MTTTQQVFTKPLNYSDLGELPNLHYWNLKSKEGWKGAQKEYFQGDWFGDQPNLTRHLFVNGVPLYFLSLHIGLPNPRWIRDPFCTLEKCIAQVASCRMEGMTIDKVEFFPIHELNKLHRSYDDDGNETVHDFTGWVHHFGGQYELTPCLIFNDLSEEDQEKFLPEESRHLLTKSLN